MVIVQSNSYKTGRKGYGFSSYVKALIYKHAQEIKSIPELIRDLESRPIISEMCGFENGKLPDEYRFYVFLVNTNNSQIQKLLYTSVKFLKSNGLVSTDIIIADSKQTKSKAYIPINPRNTKPEKTFSDNNLPLCKAGLEMKYSGLSSDSNRDRLKFRCPIKAATKKTKNKVPCCCPVNNPKFSNGNCYRRTAYIDITNDERA